MAQDIRFWQRTARLYTRMQERANIGLYSQTTEHCRPYIHSETDVLELACGTGQFTFPLCGQAKSWLATDLAENMVREGEKRNKTKAVFAVANAEELPYDDNTFDRVLIANALHIMPHPEQALQEIRRVLRPGGLLLAPTFVYEGKVNRVKLKLLDLVGFKTYYFWSASDYLEFLQAAGFCIQEQVLLREGMLPELFVCAAPKDQAEKDKK